MTGEVTSTRFADVDQWIADARSGDGAALDRLFELLSEQLWAEYSRRRRPPNLGPSHGLSDLVQETLFQAKANFHRFERDSFADFKQWVRTILRHKLQEWMRNYRFRNAPDRKEEIGLVKFECGSSAGGAAGPEYWAEIRDEGHRIHDAFQSLKTHERYIINLRVIEGLRYPEIEALTGWSKEASRKAFDRAMENLRSVLESHGTF